MNKKPIRKIQLSTTTIRLLSKDDVANVAGGAYTATPGCTLTASTGPFPSRGPCSIAA